jgi:hypothetical protein
LLALNSNSTDFVRNFEAVQEICKTIGERLRKIILRREHSPDRCSDCTIAGVGLLWQYTELATHTVLRNKVYERKHVPLGFVPQRRASWRADRQFRSILI